VTAFRSPIAAIKALIDLQPDMQVVADVARGDQIVAAARAHRPDVAVLDIDLPGLDGLSAAAQLHAIRKLRQKR